MKNIRKGLPLLVGVVLGVSISLGHGVLANKDNGGLPATEEALLLTRVLGLIRESYVEPVDDAELMGYAIRGMLDGLDPHSTFLDAEDFEQISISTKGRFGGLGIEVTLQDGFVKVVSPIDDTPAQRAGLLAGDLIIRLDDKPVKGMDLREAVGIMRGEPGSDIVLTVVRDGVGAPFKVEVTRDIIKIQSVKSRMIEPGYGYVRVTQFQEDTGNGVSKAVKELIEENEGPLNGMVLDLRNNPGGVLNAAVDVSDAFMEEGLVVYIQGREEATRRDFNARSGDVLDGGALVVLVNEGSASASEIVAGALQDQKRAVIMGRPTFGKGSVQTVLRVSPTAAVKLTTARYYTPTGRSIQAEGIVPDIAIDRVKVSVAEASIVAPIKERDLNRSLINEKGEDRGSSKGPKKGGSKADNVDAADGEEKSEKSLAERDYDLSEAINLLKGLHIFGARGQ